jgi:hypothetical protein
MTQPPYRPPDGNATRRLVLFIAVFLVIVAIGSRSQSQMRHSGKTLDSMCVCLPSRAGLILKSAIAKTQAQTTALLTIKAPVTQK